MKKKRITAVLITLALCLSVFNFTAFAAEIESQINPKAAIDDNVPGKAKDFTDEIIISYIVPDSVVELRNQANTAVAIQMDWSVNSENDWKCSGENDWSSKMKYGSWIDNTAPGRNVQQTSVFPANYKTPESCGYADICYDVDEIGGGFINLTDNTIYMRLRFWVSQNGKNSYSDWSEVFTVGETVQQDIFEASDWAQAELTVARNLGIIPDSLATADLRENITREEFAAVAVRAYEAMAGDGLTAVYVEKPFVDTANEDVLKAYALGITTGVSATEFDPTALLNREQAATMLTRVYKKAKLEGWSISTDANFALTYEKPEAFADDMNISNWAKDSVYFMAANGIINGIGNNRFAPQNTTPEEEATGYANATREQAIIIATRMVKNLK
ncbi:MAG: S-layer homology domain-containing protein [Clostridia bacterium]|nr:S-layer homology domain-containing protein [Clostridia bacterium]